VRATDFPKKLEFLFQPAPYKAAYGGRNGFKSWGFARALLLLGVSRPLRVLCAREVQLSIKASVHQLLQDQIQILGLGDKYDVLDFEIRGKNGTQFIFTGLSTHTVETIKSYESIDICWVEEGQTITARSWEILDPTIRKPGSEIWVSFNPNLESDPTYQMFITHPPPGTAAVKIGYQDAPAGWFTEEMEAKRSHAEAIMTRTKYRNIWEGECMPAVEGAIFFDEMDAMEKQQRIRNVPYDPMLKVHLVTDLGYRHACCVALVQVMTSEIRVFWYDEFINAKLSDIAVQVRMMNYNMGRVWLPYADGFSKSSKGQDSAEMIFRKAGFNVARKDEVSSLGVEQGITATRERFPRFFWDAQNCERLIEVGKRYRRVISKATLTAGAPMQDEFADGGDTIRYIAVNADSMRNDTDRKPRGRVETYQPHIA
tara:strand:- start:3238 stop:4518 length:1281 start_codon:yes stop_codon:yes gene_type:complete